MTCEVFPHREPSRFPPAHFCEPHLQGLAPILLQTPIPPQTISGTESCRRLSVTTHRNWKSCRGNRKPVRVQVRDNHVQRDRLNCLRAGLTIQRVSPQASTSRQTLLREQALPVLPCLASPKIENSTRTTFLLQS